MKTFPNPSYAPKAQALEDMQVESSLTSVDCFGSKHCSAPSPFLKAKLKTWGNNWLLHILKAGSAPQSLTF